MLYSQFWHPIRERCGLILKNGQVVELKNTHLCPETNFSIKNEELINYEGQIEVMWHSHPSNLTNLSVEDYKTFLNFPDYTHRIYGYDTFDEYYVRKGIVYMREYCET